jgi:hypothetical protein
MTYLITIFGLALFFLIVMIAYRSYELSYNKELISRQKISKIDKKLLTFYDKNIILLNRLYGNINNLPEIVSHKSHGLWEMFAGKVDTYFEKIKKNKSENNKGSVSIYWKSVSEVKDSNPNKTK